MKRHLPTLFLLVLLLRAAGFFIGVTDNDETDFLLVARVIKAGGLPYVHIFDHKPPLLYALYLPSTWQIWPMQILAVFWLTATAWICGLAAEKLRPGAGVVAAYLCVLVSACNALSVNAELLLNLPAAIALYFLIVERDLECGLFIGMAALIKHQAGILLVAPLVTRPRRMHLVLFGFALPWLAALAIYARHLSEFFEWNLTRNLGYSSQGGWLVRFLEGTFGYGLGAAPLVWWLAIKNRRAHRGLTIALAATILPIFLGGRFYNHYYLQLVPPLCILASLGRFPRARWATALLLLPLAITQIVHFTRHDYPSEEPRARAVADWLKQNSRPDARVVVYGHFSPIYQMAERMPGSRYIHTSELFGNFDATQLPADFDAARFRSRADEAALVEDLRKQRPEFFVDTSGADIKGWAKLPLRLAPDLEAAVARLYEPVASPGGATVFRLRTSEGSTRSAAHRQVTSPRSATQPNERSAPL
jgi:hypothetical protein